MYATKRDPKCLKHLIFGWSKLMWIFCVFFLLFNKPLSIFICKYEVSDPEKALALFIIFFWWHMLLATTLLKSREIFSLIFWVSFLTWPLLALYSSWIVKRRTATKSIQASIILNVLLLVCVYLADFQLICASFVVTVEVTVLSLTWEKERKIWEKEYFSDVYSLMLSESQKN